MPYKIDNGIKMEMTDAELRAMQDTQAAREAAERTRPLTAEEVTALLIKQQINTLEVDDQTACRMRAFYPAWAAGISCAVGYRVQHNGRLFRCLQAHTSQEGWEPENAPALWEEICETHDGSLYDPIPYGGNMALVSGLYYSQDDAVYLCSRDTVNPVYNQLSELVGIYVEEKGD